MIVKWITNILPFSILILVKEIPNIVSKLYALLLEIIFVLPNTLKFVLKNVDTFPPDIRFSTQEIMVVHLFCEA